MSMTSPINLTMHNFELYHETSRTIIAYKLAASHANHKTITDILSLLSDITIMYLLLISIIIFNDFDHKVLANGKYCVPKTRNTTINTMTQNPS